MFLTHRVLPTRARGCVVAIGWLAGWIVLMVFVNRWVVVVFGLAKNGRFGL